MKIVATKNDKLKMYTIDVSINYIEYVSNKITASEVESEVEDLDIKWNDFLDSIIGKIEIRNFEIIDEHESNRKNSKSYYILFYPRTSKGELRTDFLIQLRISDHKHKKEKTKKLEEEKKIKRTNYGEALKKAYMEDVKNDEAPTFETQSVIVGTKKFPDTATALSYMEYLCKALTNKNNKSLENILNEFIVEYVNSSEISD